LQALRGQFAIDTGDPGDVPARPAQAGDEAASHRVGYDGEHDGNRGGCSSSGQHGIGGGGKNDIDFFCDEFGGKCGQALEIAVRDATRGTQIALANTGGIRTSLPAGPITYGKIFEILPFENTIVTMKITGAQLKRSLAVRLTAVSGLRAVFDLRKPKGEQLVSVTLEDGSPVLDNATYAIAINDFMQAGGDDYTEFANGTDVKDTGIHLRDMVSDYIKLKKTISPVIDGRIQLVN